MLPDELILKGCRQQNAEAQMALYKKYAGKMNAVCSRYVNSSHDAKDICQEGFVKIFSSISAFKGEGSLEGWIRRIMVNTALDFLKKRNKHLFVSIEDKVVSEANPDSDNDMNFEIEQSEDVSVFDTDLTNEQLLEIINKVPEVYKLVFNLYCIENYSHKEIAEILLITEDTSRSRLRRARKILKNHVLEVISKQDVN